MRTFPGGFGSFLASGAKNQSLLALCEELRVEYKSSLLTADPPNNAQNCNKGHESSTASTKNVFLPFLFVYFDRKTHFKHQVNFGGRRRMIIF